MTRRGALLSICGAALTLPASAAGAASRPPAIRAPVCQRSAAAAPTLARLREALAHGRFVAYQPTSLGAVNGGVTAADAASIRADLEVLRGRFDSLLTYDALHGAENIAPIAAALGFRALVVGVWNPLDAEEVNAAVAVARQYPQLVLGVSLGNETLFGHRADLAGLSAAIAGVRARLPQTPLSTSEPFHVYYDPAAAALLGRLDFLLPIVHPVFQPWFRRASDSVAAQFVVNVVNELAQRYCGPILVKETGVPTAPQDEGFSEARQASFYLALRRTFRADGARAFAYFSAFDAPWRAYDATPVPGVHPEEAYWGLYDARRHAKRAASELPALAAQDRTPQLR